MIKQLFFLGVGIHIEYLVLTGKLNYYVNPVYTGFIAVTGAVLIFVYSSILILSIRNREITVDKHDLMYLPLFVVIFFLSPATLGNSIAANRGVSAVEYREQTFSTNSLLAINTESFTMNDWIDITIYLTDLERYANKEINVEGTLFHINSTDLLGKYFVTCCAVDASVYGLLIELPDSVSTTAGKWYEVSGTTKMNDEGNIVIVAKTLEEISQPNDPYYHF